ncbi:MAG TPA: PIN domain-containing protein [Candidatus Polarisedimenticolia bacterium]|nr:PIN domain-containing protein [Candidatus Polarisedimenticolia bacterium]
MGTWILRGVLILLSIVIAGQVRPPSLNPFDLSGPALGAAAAGVIIALEYLLKTLEMNVLLGGLAGLLLGGAAAGVVVGHLPLEGLLLPPLVLKGFLFLLFGYTGMAIGAARGERFSLSSLRAAWAEGGQRRNHKILDTSVIIDGRIADVCETGFLDGTLVVPQFVLRELQYIADSQDSLKRNRGRKGLDILQRIKKGSDVRVMISEVDFPDVKEVDMKLIELAKQLTGKIITNDFNLNKVAELRGVQVLNINNLANSLKPVVLPGESMKVFILKEGKEANQGVGYLDDGTMVVVDNAKRHIGRNIDITVTSVLQTTAGKMFFGKSEAADEAVAADQRTRRTGP